MLASKESVTAAIVAWAKRRIMNNPFSSKELEELLEAARAAGRAEGYAQAKLEMALERVNATAETTKAKQESPASQVTPPHVRKLQELSAEAQRA
jgi:hypothetical protein